MLSRVEIYNPNNKVSTFETIDIEENDSITYKNEICETLPIIIHTCENLLEENKNYMDVLDGLINNLLNITKSEFGAFLTIKSSRYEKEFLCISFAESSPGTFYAGKNPKSVVFKSTSGIFGYIMKNMINVISDNVLLDPRSKIKDDFPEGHPVVNQFLGIPIVVSGEFNGILCFCNTSLENGYTLDMLKYIKNPVKVASLLCKRINNEIDNMNDNINNATSSDAMKDRFLVTMSHEIRTPLNGMMGMVTMLGDAGPLTEKQSEYVINLTECVFQLSNLMNNILDFSKMTSNRFYLLKQPFSLHDVVDDVIKMVEGGAMVKNIEIRKYLPSRSELPNFVGDPQRIIQILSNLLNNAIKFTEKGFVSLKLKPKPIKDDSEPGKKYNICIEISDTGVGIPQEEQSKIFDVFHQVSTLSTYVSNSGTGLGLSIVRELVRLMGGSITVKSEGIQGRGSTFSFNIILEEEITIDNLSSNSDLFKGSRILVVDDRSEIRLQLTEMLMKWDCLPFVVASAEEGLKYIKCGMDFKIILVDICMPYMSGVEMAQELKRIVPTTPLIGISSVDLNTGEEYFDVYMFKPVNQNQLFTAMLKCFNKKKPSIAHPTGIFRSKTRSDGTPSRKQRSKSNLKILIAEDEKHNAFTIKEMLYNLGFRKYEIVSNGKDCVEKVKKENFDVVLMDIIMPIMDGVEATRHIRSLANPPYIIAISAAVLNSDKERCQSAGIDAYLPKPITKEKLNGALDPLVRKYKTKKKHPKRSSSDSQ